jgi:hypothetical protein
MIYLNAISTGKGFITTTDRLRFSISGYTADIWVVEDNRYGKQWADEQARFNEGQIITKSEAQALINSSCEGKVDENGNSLIPPELP